MDRRERLEWLRDQLVASFAEADVTHRAALAKQLRDTLTDLDSLPVKASGDPVDEFTARLEGRRAKAARPSGSRSGGQSRKRSG